MREQNFSPDSEKRRFVSELKHSTPQIDNNAVKDYISKSITCLTHPKVIAGLCCDCHTPVFHPVRCNHRFFCPECTRLKSLRQKGKYGHLISSAQKRPLFFTTITIKNPGFGELDKNFLKKVKKIFFNLRRPESSPLHDRGIAHFECPVGKDGKSWNLHIHIIHSSDRYNSPKYIQCILRFMLRRWTMKFIPDNESFVVDSRFADTASFRELLKYSMKLEIAEQVLRDPFATTEFLKAFKGVRLLWTWGDWNGNIEPYKTVCPHCGGELLYLTVSETERYIKNKYLYENDIAPP